MDADEPDNLLNEPRLFAAAAVSEAKIDREFVSHVETRADSLTICRALIDVTAGIELSVLAEGVERYEGDRKRRPGARRIQRIPTQC
jgi:predicted signal transduction protein with EAL and GGDEF domain